jgi:hypothetical protein
VGSFISVRSHQASVLYPERGGDTVWAGAGTVPVRDRCMIIDQRINASTPTPPVRGSAGLVEVPDSWKCRTRGSAGLVEVPDSLRKVFDSSRRCLGLLRVGARAHSTADLGRQHSSLPLATCALSSPSAQLKELSVRLQISRRSQYEWGQKPELHWP